MKTFACRTLLRPPLVAIPKAINVSVRKLPRQDLFEVAYGDVNGNVIRLKAGIRLGNEIRLGEKPKRLQRHSIAGIILKTPGWVVRCGVNQGFHEPGQCKPYRIGNSPPFAVDGCMRERQRSRIAYIQCRIDARLGKQSGCEKRGVNALSRVIPVP